MSEKTTASYQTSWILLLVLLTAIAPLSTDMSLPTLLEMTNNYGVSTLLIANSLPAYFVGLALGQLIYGPLSDRIGRKIPLIFVLSFHIIASVLCFIFVIFKTYYLYEFYRH